MTGASTGLQKALARAGSGVVAIAEMTAEDLIAQMTDEQRSALAASLAPPASEAKAAAKSEPKPGEEDGDGDGDDSAMKGKDAETGSEASAADLAKARAEGFAEATARAVAVITHEDFGGRAKAAASLLGNPKLSSLTSDEIVEMLADKPDEGAAAMAAALSADKNPAIGSGGSGADTARADNHGWGKAVAKINARFGPKD